MGNERTRVRVYRNLHTGTLSMQAYIPEKKGWRVVGHPDHVQLSNVKFVVREAGRQRVLKEKRKNVHAWIEGDLVCKGLGTYQQIAKYNPYKYDSWVSGEGHDLTNVDFNWSFACVSGDGKVTFAPTRW